MRINADMLQQSLHNDLSNVIDVNNPSWSIDNSPEQVACYRLKESLLKKFNQQDKPSVNACEAALGKFLAVNNRMRDWELVLNHVQPDWELLGMLKSELKEFLDPSNEGPIFGDYTEMFHLGYAGPGASIDAKGTDFYTKMFGSELTSTAGLSDVWSTLVRKNEQFRLAYCDAAAISTIKVVDHNKLSFVNKNQDVARCICTEPSINMWMQLGMGAILHNRMKVRYGIDFRVQPEVNRRLARLGSLLDRHVTIDLESASDSLGLKMMDEVFPRNFMGMLRRLRSPNCRLPNGSLVPLEMVSTMGNGFTFPLQTLLFVASCAVVYRYLGIPFVSKGAWSVRTVSVFGDDIIVLKEASRLLLKLLGILGFVVNDSKTYVEGPFRESCGHDRFLGRDVRPVYIKRLVTLQDAFVAINKLNEWSAKTGIPLRNTVHYILSCYPSARKCVVPFEEADDAGVKVPAELLDRTSKSVPGSFGLLRYVCSVPVFFGYRVDTDVCRLIRHPDRTVPYNPNGLYLAFLGGYVRGYLVSGESGFKSWQHRVSVRQQRTRYITKRKVTPRWDYLLPTTLSDFLDRGQRLSRAVKANFF